jgi:hypothetical protein
LPHCDTISIIGKDSTMPKKLAFKPAEAAQAGSTHRTEEHLGGRQVTLDEAIRTASRRPVGRKPSFAGETQRLNAFLPPDLVRKIKAGASMNGKTISEFIADWAKTL